MDSGPSEYSRYLLAFAGMNPNSFGGSYLVIASAIALYIDQTVIGNIGNKPRNFIGMCFDSHLEFFTGVYNTINSSVIINLLLINSRLNVTEPKLLAFCLKTCGRRIIDIRFKKPFV